MWGLVGEGPLGGKYDNSRSILIYGQDRGAPVDARHARPAKANVYPNDSVLFFTSSAARRLCRLIGGGSTLLPAFYTILADFAKIRLVEGVNFGLFFCLAFFC